MAAAANGRRAQSRSPKLFAQNRNPAIGRLQTLATDQSPPDADTLPLALIRHGLALPPEQVAQLDRYCRLLWDWNEKLNLTRHTDYEKFVARDLVDSLALAEQLSPGERVLDVGTGGGVPGVVLAIVRPDLAVELCESVAKRAKVVADIVRELGLAVSVHHAPVQSVLAARSYDTLVARAVAPLPKVLTWLAPHWGQFGRLLIIKGPKWVEERGEARHRGLMRSLVLRRVKAYPLAGTDSESVVLAITPKGTDE